MKPVASLAALLLAAAQIAPALAQPAPSPRGGQATMRRFPGVSDAGNAILAEAQNAPDAQLAALVRQQRALHDAFAATAMAPTIDLDKVQTLMKQRQDLQAQIGQRNDERLLATIRQLPIADRGPFMRALLSPGPR